MQRFKWQFQLLMAVLIIFASAVFTGFYIYEINQHRDERTQNSANYINTVYNSVINNMQHTYKYRAYGNLLISGFNEALIAQDREKLYSLIENRYKTMQEENRYLKIMQFHAPDGTSILRVHEKEKYGDNIASKRPLLRRVHAIKEIQSGFEGGIAGVAYRVVVPYFKDNRYIGAVEFGVDVHYISEEIEKISGLKSLFLLHESRIAAASSRSEYNIHKGAYYPIQFESDQYEILKLYTKNNLNYEKKVINYHDHHYEILPIRLKGDDGKEMGIFLCMNDITAGYDDLTRTIVGSVLITCLLIIFFLGINESIARIFMKRVRFQEEYIETILNSQSNIIIVTDDRNIVYVNNAFLEYFHYRTLEDFSKDHDCICDLFQSTESDGYLLPIIDGMRWTEYIMAHSAREHKVKMTVDGKASTFIVTLKRIEHDKELRYVVVFSDITELNELATMDRLTQVTNRFEFDKILEHSLSVSRRYKRPLSVLLLDIDHFKQINDRFGHLTGDAVLKALSELLRKQIRESDVVARWGGEEFMILLPDTPLPSAIKMAEALRQRIEVNSFETIKSLTCSIGVAEFNPVEEADDLFNRADEKLYAAKKAGRNRIVA
ncbi:MAG: diguanylate cyclase [Sulfuricurvum sp.]|nr:diguanylate cyclase [Sulfuricurvum sp.]